MGTIGINLAMIIADRKSGIKGRKTRNLRELEKWNYAYREAYNLVESWELVGVVATLMTALYAIMWITW